MDRASDAHGTVVTMFVLDPRERSNAVIEPAEQIERLTEVSAGDHATYLRRGADASAAMDERYLLHVETVPTAGAAQERGVALATTTAAEVASHRERPDAEAFDEAPANSAAAVFVEVFNGHHPRAN